MNRAILILLLAFFGVWAALLLGGCHHSGPLKSSGEEAPAPYGFVDYCNRHPDRAECGGTQ
jgi:hypothetical protein